VRRQERPPWRVAVLAKSGRLVLFNNGQPRKLRLNQTHLKLLACLLDNLGRVVPYQRLVSAVGHKSVRLPTLHILRQYTALLRGVLTRNKAPYLLAVAPESGYALCKIADWQFHNSIDRRTALLPEVGRNVRRLRTAAGLTQTALAERSGIDRTYLSDLEAGRRNPTVTTLARLAKALGVRPSYLFD
jgi:DNA-binding XRE family transcriptional regulator